MRARLSLLALSLALAACNGQGAMDHAGMDMRDPPLHHGSVPGVDASTQAYRNDMQMMHGAMMSEHYTGNADIDFAAGMIPHHQGAVDMAHTELDYGHDPKMRALAKDIIKSQDEQIAFMKHWLATHPAPDAK